MRGSRSKRERRPLPPGIRRHLDDGRARPHRLRDPVPGPRPLRARRRARRRQWPGLLVASFSIAQVVFSPITGRLSDRFGRKPIIILSLAGTAVGSLLTGLAGSLWLLFLARIIDGASGASVSVAQAAVTDVAPEEERARLLGLLGAAFGAGFALGPAIGGIAALVSHRLPFFIAAAIAASTRSPPSAVCPRPIRNRSHAPSDRCRSALPPSRTTNVERPAAAAARHVRVPRRFQRLRGDVLAPHRGSLRPVGERDLRRVLPHRHGPGVRARRAHPSRRRPARRDDDGARRPGVQRHRPRPRRGRRRMDDARPPRSSCSSSGRDWPRRRCQHWSPAGRRRIAAA